MSLPHTTCALLPADKQPKRERLLQIVHFSQNMEILCIETAYKNAMESTAALILRKLQVEKTYCTFLKSSAC